MNNIGAFTRAKAVAAAAMNCITGSNGSGGRRLLVSGRKGEDHGVAFFALSVGALWRAAKRVGLALGVANGEIENCDQQAAVCEAQASVCNKLQGVAQSFGESFVQPYEAKVREMRDDTATGNLAERVLQAMAVEILQRRCAAYGEQVVLWESDLARMEDRGRFAHAEQLLMLICGHLSSAISIADEAGLRSTALRDHLDHSVQRRTECLARRDTRNADDAGNVGAAHRERRPLTYFGSCIGKPMDRSSTHLHVIICMRAVAAAARASRVTASQGSRLNANTALQTNARRTMTACDHVLHAMMQDGLTNQVASYLAGDRNRNSKLLAVAFFQQFSHCGPEAREASFSHLDIMLTALAAPRHAEDGELQACICSLMHDLVFGGGCEERMVMRLQREASPRTATSLEEWFLDTLLVQHGAQGFREQIQQPTQADAWLACSSSGTCNDGLGAFFNDEGEGLVRPG